MFYKTAFISIFIILLLSLSACSDDSKGQAVDVAAEKVVVSAEAPKAAPQEEKAESEVKIEIPPNARLVTAEEGLRMRDKPTLDGEVVCVIPFEDSVILLEEKGEEATISGKIGRWSLVQWNDKKGWVFGGFLTESITGTITVGGEPMEVELYKGTKEKLVGMFINFDDWKIIESYAWLIIEYNTYKIRYFADDPCCEIGDLKFENCNMLTFISNSDPLARYMSDPDIGLEKFIKEKTTFKVWVKKDDPNFMVFQSDILTFGIKKKK
jgi:hypothetical protein